MGGLVCIPREHLGDDAGRATIPRDDHLGGPTAPFPSEFTMNFGRATDTIRPEREAGLGGIH